MSLNRFETSFATFHTLIRMSPPYNDKLFHMRQMEDACNANVTKVFEPSWVSVLYKIMQEWISKYTCPAWVYVGRKPYPFGNERHTIACGLSTIMWFAEIVEGIDENHRVITLILKIYGNLPLCLENYALFSLPPISTTIIYKYPLMYIIYLGEPSGGIITNYHGTFIHIFMH